MSDFRVVPWSPDWAVQLEAVMPSCVTRWSTFRRIWRLDGG
ncbi:hypothetical protein [Nocardioides potassii]|nr:hypothetical protein [Nocardioides potassii]